MDSGPIRYVAAVKLPLAFENPVNEVLVVTAILTAKLVIRSHDCDAVPLFDSRFEAWKIDLAQRPFVHLRVHSVAIQFLAVGGKVLYAGRDVLTLDSLNFRRDQRCD